MKVLVWVTEATWPACVDALREHAPADAQVTLLHVADPTVATVAGGARAGLLGRAATPDGDPGGSLRRMADDAGRALLAAAQERAGRVVSLEQRHGRVEREVVAACSGVDLLVLARDGELSRLGPHSLGRDTRFVLDHAPCAVLLVWPGSAPPVGSIPPPPQEPPAGPPGRRR